MSWVWKPRSGVGAGVGVGAAEPLDAGFALDAGFELESGALLSVGAADGAPEPAGRSPAAEFPGGGVRNVTHSHACVFDRVRNRSAAITTTIAPPPRMNTR
jgi:hypothetical protein